MTSHVHSRKRLRSSIVIYARGRHGRGTIMPPNSGAGPCLQAGSQPKSDIVNAKGDSAVSAVAPARSFASAESVAPCELPRPRAFQGALIALLLSILFWTLVVWAVTRFLL